MNTPLTHALSITVIGMGLVFAAILALWGMMEVLVRLTQPRKETIRQAETEPEKAYVSIIPETEICKRRAAALAVVTAIALTRARLGMAAEPRRGLTSSWQVTLRAGRFAQRAHPFNRWRRGK